MARRALLVTAAVLFAIAAFMLAIQPAGSIGEAEPMPDAIETPTVPEPVPQEEAVVPAPAPEPVPYDGRQCGGRLPPCTVMTRESGGDSRIWNGRCYAPVGWAGRRSPCGGSTASGKWQVVRDTWARFGGYLNAADAPVEVQDAKAEALWARGAGGFHWGLGRPARRAHCRRHCHRRR